jgi:hypothetical protein
MLLCQVQTFHQKKKEKKLPRDSPPHSHSSSHEKTCGKLQTGSSEFLKVAQNVIESLPNRKGKQHASTEIRSDFYAPTRSWPKKTPKSLACFMNKAEKLAQTHLERLGVSALSAKTAPKLSHSILSFTQQVCSECLLCARPWTRSWGCPRERMWFSDADSVNETLCQGIMSPTPHWGQRSLRKLPSRMTQKLRLRKEMRPPPFPSHQCPHHE